MDSADAFINSVSGLGTSKDKAAFGRFEHTSLSGPGTTSASPTFLPLQRLARCFACLACLAFEPPGKNAVIFAIDIAHGLNRLGYDASFRP
jgi:hypothetical protein